MCRRRFQIRYQSRSLILNRCRYRYRFRSPSRYRFLIRCHCRCLIHCRNLSLSRILKWWCLSL
jgi:hypothetical protein